jgi:hypothetical protein
MLDAIIFYFLFINYLRQALELPPTCAKLNAKPINYSPQVKILNPCGFRAGFEMTAQSKPYLKYFLHDPPNQAT